MPLSDDLPPTPDPLFPFAEGDYPDGLFLNTWDGQPRREIAGAEAFASTGLTPNLRTGAQLLNNYLGVNSEQYAYNQATGHTGMFGDASDGDFTEVANRVLDRPYYYNDWTIDSGWVVTTAGWPVFVRGTLLIDGVGSMLEWNGLDAVLGVPGVAQVSAMLAGGAAGGTGVGAGQGIGGDSTHAALTGGGGDAGAGQVPGGLGGVSTIAAADTRTLSMAMRGSTISLGVLTALTSGAGGGGGGPGGGAGIDGGGGGGGAGHMLIVARNVEIHNGGALHAIGGAGGAGTDDAVDAGGGGGGGQGGTIYLIYRQFSDLIGIGGTVSVAGGAAGAAGVGVPNGTIGNVGGDGLIIPIAG